MFHLFLFEVIQQTWTATGVLKIFSKTILENYPYNK